MKLSMSQTNGCREVSRQQLERMTGGAKCSLLECGWDEFAPNPNDPPHCCDGTIVAICGCTGEIVDR